MFYLIMFDILVYRGVSDFISGMVNIMDWTELFLWRIGISWGTSWNLMGPAGMVFDANLEGEEVQELKVLHFWRPNYIYLS